jgi:hypothetical protein
MADVLAKLQKAVGVSFEALAKTGLLYALIVLREKKVSDGGGGQIVQFENITVADAIPCEVETLKERGEKEISIARVTTDVRYLIRFPAVYRGSAVDVTRRDLLRVFERGFEPQREFRIHDFRETDGVIFEAICSLNTD